MAPPSAEPAPFSITIALPVYNERETLAAITGQAIEVLLALPNHPGEILIVNDGSTDESGAIGADLAQKHEKVRLVEHPRNLGFAAVQRACYENAACDWVFVLPADGQIDPNVLLDFLVLCADHDLILGVAQNAPERGLRRIVSRTYHAWARRLFALPKGDFGACLLVRRSLAVAVEHRSTTPVAMTELLLRIRARAGRIAFRNVTKHPRHAGKAKGALLHWQLFRILRDLLVLYKAFGRSSRV